MIEGQEIDDYQLQRPIQEVQRDQVHNVQMGNAPDHAIVIVDESDNEKVVNMPIKNSDTMELEDIEIESEEHIQHMAQGQQSNFQQQQQQKEIIQMGNHIRQQGQDSRIQQQISEQKQQDHDIAEEFQKSQPQQANIQQNIQKLRIFSQQQQKQKSRSKSPDMRILHNFRFLLENHSHYEIKTKIEDHIDHWRSYKTKLQWNNFYTDLEYDHAFIQWVSPNFFKSMFNSSSYALTFEERVKMIEDDEIMRRYLENIYMYIRFLGFEIFVENKYHVLNLVDKDQFERCLFKQTHNQMRIQRVLASLSVLGQRSIAISFLEPLNYYIQKCGQDSYDKKLYDRLFSNYEILEEELKYKEICLSAQPKQLQNSNYKDKSQKPKPFENYKNYYFPKEMLNSKEVTVEILKDRSNPALIVYYKRT